MDLTRFFENALITRKPSVEVEGLQKVIPKIFPKSRKKYFFAPKLTILPSWSEILSKVKFS